MVIALRKNVRIESDSCLRKKAATGFAPVAAWLFVLRPRLMRGWTSPGIVDTSKPQNEARSNASGLTPPRWLCRLAETRRPARTACLNSNSCGSRFHGGFIHRRIWTLRLKASYELQKPLIKSADYDLSMNRMCCASSRRDSSPSDTANVVESPH